MARGTADNLHSRLVAVLKVALPLAALAILSTLFLFSSGIDPEDAIPYAQVDVEDRLREPRMTEAGYSGMTPDGAALILTAVEARPEAGGGSASGLQGQLATADGARTKIAAMGARIDNACVWRMEQFQDPTDWCSHERLAEWSTGRRQRHHGKLLRP